MTLEPPPALVAYIGDFAADAKQYICNSAGPVGYGSRRMPSNKWVLVALLSLVAGGAYAQSNPISCTPNTGYPWPSGGCLNLTDLNAAFAGMGTLTPLSGGWAPQATGPAVFRSSLSVIGTGGYYAPAGTINAISDRVFVGQSAAVYNGSTEDSSWIAGWNNLNDLATAQFGVLSTNGQAAILGASRTSDYGALDQNRSIGGVFYGINNRTDGSSAWALYGEAHRVPGQTGFTTGMELDIANHGSTVDITPSMISPPGVNVALWLASGTTSATGPASAAFGVVNNLQKFRKGGVFQSSALDPALGTGGSGVALEMAPGQSIRWLQSDGSTLAELWGASAGLVLGSGSVTLTGVAVPAAPHSDQFVIYMDSADNKLKARGPSGTVTVLANP